MVDEEVEDTLREIRERVRKMTEIKADGPVTVASSASNGSHVSGNESEPKTAETMARIDAYLIDPQGVILASSSKTGALKRNVVDMQPVRSFLADNPLPILGDDPVDDRARRVFSATRLKLDDRGDAYLYLVIRGIRTESAVQHILESYVLRENIALVGGGLLLALGASALIIGIMTRRLQRLAQVMDRFRGSGFAEPPTRNAPRRTGDDIDRLAGTFEEMAERMLGQMQQLQRTDSMRRELFANISHDLRTPLASLQGHLETLQLKGDRLSADEKRGYMEIALRQSEQLNKLVAKLFELAKLDSEQASILPEPFVVEDLVQDVAQEFVERAGPVLGPMLSAVRAQRIHEAGGVLRSVLGRMRTHRVILRAMAPIRAVNLSANSFSLGTQHTPPVTRR
jgi:signal transduction histidine kinase